MALDQRDLLRRTGASVIHSSENVEMLTAIRIVITLSSWSCSPTLCDFASRSSRRPGFPSCSRS